MGARMRTSKKMTIALSVALAAISVIFLLVFGYRSQGALKESGLTVFSVLLSIGVVSLIYEVWIRELVSAEMLDMMSVKESVARSGLKDINLRTHVDWRSLYFGSSSYTILPRDVASFATREWSFILEAGRARPIRVRLLLPKSDGTCFDSLEHHLGKQPGSLRNAVDDARESIIRSWRAASKADPGLKSGCNLEVYEYDDFPACGVLVTDDSLALELDASLPREAQDEGVLLVFDPRRQDCHAAWALIQLERVMTDDRLVDVKAVGSTDEH
jgi:hypothetical protein